MKTRKINPGFEQLESIMHIADIHIRNYQRHKEYREVFSELYKAADKLPESSIIYVGGDIVHNKTDISPELVNITSEFLRNLANHRPTIVITGNHDANLNNPNRLDALTPMVDNLNHPNLHYIKDTEIVELADVELHVLSCLDTVDNYPKLDTPSTKKRIALFHGPVQSSKTDIGYEITGAEYTSDMFDNYDLALLGDIHKRQFVDKEKRICYVGSLIQQNFGESFNKHGYALWDMNTLKPKFFDIPNNYGFYTIKITDGILPNIDDIPKYPRLRLKTHNTTEAQLKVNLKEIKKKCKVKDIVVIKEDKIKGHAQTSRALTRDIRDVNYQNKLIKEYIEKNHDVEPSLLSEIRAINKNLNSELSNEGITRSVSWKLKTFEFSNMFSYGEDNIVNFHKAKDVVGIFAPNHAGKSAILDSVSFCMFDRCSRGKLATDIMNNKKNTFSCLLNFEIDGIDYFIERRAKRILKGWQKGKVRVDVDFWYIDEEGSKVSLNGEQRRETNNAIRGYVGEYEDFVLTALSVQNNNTGFIDMSQFEKKDLLSQFLDITVFEELYQLANEEIRDVQALLKDFSNTDFSQQQIDAETELTDYTEQVKVNKQEVSRIKKELKAVNKDIIYNTKKLHKKLLVTDITGLDTEKDNLTSQIDKINKRLSEDEQTAISNKAKKKNSEEAILEYNEAGLIQLYDTYINLQATLKKELHKKEILKKDVQYKQEKLNTKYSFDPNCSFCKERESEQVKIIQETTDSLNQDKIKASELMRTINYLTDDIEKLEYTKPAMERYNKLNQVIAQLERERSTGRIAYYQQKDIRDKLQLRILEIDNTVAQYNDNLKAITANKQIYKEIDLLKDKEVQLNGELETVSDVLIQATSNTSVLKQKLKDINNSIKKAHLLETKLQAYEYYLDAIKRDGIPYEIMADTLPYIEDEVNAILSQVVDFELKFDVDGKNILTYISYGEGNQWPLEMTSGMEKFISSLAIRVALINISSLPRPTFLAIDEGFGNLDTNNITSIAMLFDYLKTEFDFIMIISHIDIMRDMVDDLVEITKEKNFSKVIY